MRNHGIQQLAAWLACGVLLSCLRGEVAQAQTDAPPAVVDGTNQPLDLQELFRANLQLQEQLRATRLALEQNQKEADGAAARNAEITRNAEVMSARLNLLEQELAGQRARELELMQSSNRFLLIVAATVASVVILGVLLTAYLEWRA